MTRKVNNLTLPKKFLISPESIRVKDKEVIEELFGVDSGVIWLYPFEMIPDLSQVENFEFRKK